MISRDDLEARLIAASLGVDVDGVVRDINGVEYKWDGKTAVFDPELERAFLEEPSDEVGE